LNGEIFYNLKEAQAVIEQWRLKAVCEYIRMRAFHGAVFWVSGWGACIERS
jgi:hypothetical protein